MNVKSVLYNNFAHWDERYPDWKRSVIHRDSHIDDITADDVLILHGGTDINPWLYGELPEGHTDFPDRERDEFEVRAIKQALKVGAKLFGICRGAQLLTALNGGKLIQHIEGHHSTHKLDEFAGIATSSCHHQAMIPSETAQVIATHDGIPEIVYYAPTNSYCVQGHPEWMSSSHPFVELNFKLCRELWGI